MWGTRASLTVVPADTIDLPAAARQLGVHYQTAYKWVRSGDLPAALVMGSYSLDRGAVARFAERRARPVPPRTRRPRTGFGVLARRVHDHLVAGEERQAARLISGLVGGGVSMTAVAQDVLAPALRDIGEEWRAGGLDISIEHRRSSIGSSGSATPISEAGAVVPPLSQRFLATSMSCRRRWPRFLCATTTGSCTILEPICRPTSWCGSAKGSMSTSSCSR